jgi:hypothetical protein
MHDTYQNVVYCTKAPMFGYTICIQRKTGQSDVMQYDSQFEYIANWRELTSQLSDIQSAANVSIRRRFSRIMVYYLTTFLL